MKKQMIAIGYTLFQIATISSTANAATVITNTSGQPYCREYTQTFTVGNTTQKGYGTACLQPDGSWEIQKPAAVQAPGQVVVEQQPITYVVRENHTYVVPARPYNEEVVIIGEPPHYRHHRW